MPWRPLLTGDVAARARLAVDSIAEALAAAPGSLSGPHRAEWHASLALGAAGAGIFLTDLALAQTEPRLVAQHRAAAGRLFAAAADQAGGLARPALFAGFPGVAWAIEYARRAAGEHEDGAVDNDDVDGLLLELLDEGPWPHELELYSGLAGLGVYALARRRHAAGGRLLDAVVRELLAAATTRDGAVVWLTRGLPEAPADYVDLGAAHGVPGIVALLAAAVAAGTTHATEATRAIERAWPWLWATATGDRPGHRFPRGNAVGGVPPLDMLGWCRGDPGVAGVLHAAARNLGRRDWAAQALAVALEAASISPRATGVDYAGLCHGAAGLAHIFNRLGQAADEPRLADAARAWFEVALDFRSSTGGVGGFVCPGRPDSPTRLAAEPGLISGAAGIGLALVAATSDVEPAWDRILLLS